VVRKFQYSNSVPSLRKPQVLFPGWSALGGVDAFAQCLNEIRSICNFSFTLTVARLHAVNCGAPSPPWPFHCCFNRFADCQVSVSILLVLDRSYEAAIFSDAPFFFSTPFGWRIDNPEPFNMNYCKPYREVSPAPRLVKRDIEVLKQEGYFSYCSTGNALLLNTCTKSGGFDDWLRQSPSVSRVRLARHDHRHPPPMKMVSARGEPDGGSDVSGDGSRLRPHA
jgi:hypothetical protein